MADTNFTTLRELLIFLNTLTDDELDSTTAGTTYSDDIASGTTDIVVNNGQFQFVGSTDDV